MSTYKKTTKSGKISWYCSFYYTDFQGVRHQKKKEGFKLEREAKQYERDFLAKFNRTTTATLADVAADFLDNIKKQGRAFNTIRDYTFIINKHISPAFGSRAIADITPSEVIEWEKGMEGKSARHRLIVLKSIFSHAMKFYGLKENPARVAGRTGIKRANKKENGLHFWTLEQFKRFYAELLKKDKKHYTALFSLLFFSGCRIGEALALTPADLEGNTISISKNYIYTAGKTGSTKTPSGERKIILPDFVMQHIKEHLKTLEPYQDNTLIFPLTPSPVRLILRNLTAAAELPPIRLHDFRHSHASYLINKGYSLQVIKERLGHKDIKTTINIYAHLYPSKQESIAADLQAEFTAPPKKKRYKFIRRP